MTCPYKSVDPIADPSYREWILSIKAGDKVAIPTLSGSVGFRTVRAVSEAHIRIADLSFNRIEEPEEFLDGKRVVFERRLHIGSAKLKGGKNFYIPLYHPEDPVILEFLRMRGS